MCCSSCVSERPAPIEIVLEGTTCWYDKFAVTPQNEQKHKSDTGHSIARAPMVNKLQVEALKVAEAKEKWVVVFSFQIPGTRSTRTFWA